MSEEKKIVSTNESENNSSGNTYEVVGIVIKSIFLAIMAVSLIVCAVCLVKLWGSMFDSAKKDADTLVYVEITQGDKTITYKNVKKGSIREPSMLSPDRMSFTDENGDTVEYHNVSYKVVPMEKETNSQDSLEGVAFKTGDGDVYLTDDNGVAGDYREPDTRS